jgi:hypothetical protein
VPGLIFAVESLGDDLTRCPSDGLDRRRLGLDQSVDRRLGESDTHET